MEKVILVNELDQETGCGEKLAVHQAGLLHRAFSVFLWRDGQLLLQKRAQGKYHSAGLWANTCCSHPRAGQGLAEAAAIRLKEECGIEGVSLRETGSFLYRAVFPNGLTEYEFDHVFVGEYGGGFSPDQEEISELRYIPLHELKRDLMEHPEGYAAWFFTALGIAKAGR